MNKSFLPRDKKQASAPSFVGLAFLLPLLWHYLFFKYDELYLGVHKHLHLSIAEEENFHRHIYRYGK